MDWRGKPVAVDADGLPSPLRFRLAFDWKALLCGALVDLAIQVVLQQLGARPLPPLALAEAAAVGIVAGVLFPSLGRLAGVLWVNRTLRKARRERAAKPKPPAATGWLPALALATLAVSLTLLPPQSSASVQGPCEMAVGGEGLAGGTPSVTVPVNGSLPYSVAAAAGIERLSVILHYGPIERTLHNRTYAGGQSATAGHFSLAPYLDLGSGVYVAEILLELGDGQACRGKVELLVAGDLLSTPLGIAATAVLGVAGAGLLLIFLQGLVDARDVVGTVRDVAGEARGVVRAAATDAGADAAGAPPADGAPGGGTGTAPEGEGPPKPP